MMKANVLGTEYTITIETEETEPYLKECDGFCDYSVKKIVVKKFERTPSSVENLDWYTHKVIRHELVHAFFYESGLHCECDWANNEQLVDWIAAQIPKLSKLFDQLDII